MLKEVFIYPIYNEDRTKVIATEKQVKIFGVSVLRKRIEHPETESGEYEYFPII